MGYDLVAFKGKSQFKFLLTSSESFADLFIYLNFACKTSRDVSSRPKTRPQNANLYSFVTIRPLPRRNS